MVLRWRSSLPDPIYLTLEPEAESESLPPFPRHLAPQYEMGDYTLPTYARLEIMKCWLAPIAKMVEEHIQDFEYFNPISRAASAIEAEVNARRKHMLYLAGPGLRSAGVACMLGKLLSRKAVKFDKFQGFPNIGGEDECAQIAAEGALWDMLHNGKVPVAVDVE